MAGRLSKLEVTCNNQREEIKDKVYLELLLMLTCENRISLLIR